MAKAKKPTLKQRIAFDNTLMAIKNGKGIELKQIMIKSGYSPSTAEHPAQNLTNKPQWQEMLNKIDNQGILNVFYEIMNDRDENGRLKDKDVVIKAAKELASLKDLYPAQKNKIVGMFESFNSLQEKKEDD